MKNNKHEIYIVISFKRYNIRLFFFHSKKGKMELKKKKKKKKKNVV